MNQIELSINEHELSQFVNLLQLAQSSSNQKQAQVFHTLRSIQQKSTSYIYLSYIFSSNNYATGIRKMGGLTMSSFLKRNKNHLHFEPAELLHVKESLLRVNHPELNKVKSMVISELINRNHFDYELFSELINGIIDNSENVNMVNIILEDIRFNNENYNVFENKTFYSIMVMIYQRILHLLLTQLHKDMNNQFIVSYLKCINLLTFHCPNHLYHFLSQYLDNIIQPILMLSLSENIHIKIVEQLLQGLNQIAATKFTLISHSLLEIILSYQCATPELQKIWTNIIIDILQNDQNNLIQLKLPIILPKAIDGLTFTANDERNIKEEMQVEHNPYEQKEQIEQQEKQSEILAASYSGASGYTLRKLSFQLIQKISIHFPQGLWSQWSDYIGARLKSQNHFICQTAISFIAIISETCMYDDMSQHLQQISLYLFEKATSNHSALVRATSIWALQKIFPAIKDNTNVLPYCLRLIFEGIQANSSEGTHTTHLMAKEAAVSFLDQILSQDILFLKNNNQTTPTVSLETFEQIVNALLYGLHLFRGRALFIIFKAISTMFESSFKEIISESTCNKMVSELCSKWTTCVKNDSVMCPLLECLITAYESTRKYLEKYNIQFFNQVLPLLQLTNRKQLVLRCMDFLSSMVTTGSSNLTPLVLNKDFLQIIYSLAVNEQKEIKHFTYILISDIGKRYDISQYVQKFVLMIAQTMDAKSLTSRNNALMCLTELLETYYIALHQYLQQIMSKVVEVINKEELPKVYAFNFARMFGRLCLLNLQNAKKQIISCPKLIQFAFISLKTREVQAITSNSFKGLLLTLDTFSSEELTIVGPQLEIIFDALICYPIRRQQTPENEAILQLFIRFARSMKAKLSKGRWEEIVSSPIFLHGALRTLYSWTQ